MAPFFFFFTGRLRTTILRSLHSMKLTGPSMVSPFGTLSSHNFCQAFHQTVVKPPYISHFSTFGSSPNQCIYDPIDFTEYAFHSTTSLDCRRRVLLKEASQFPSEMEAVDFLDGSGWKLDSSSVCSVIWALRHEWELAYLVFKWGVKRSCCDAKVWHLMIWVLGNCGKFNICWGLVKKLSRSKMVTGKELLILIDRYAAASDPEKAIRTFHILEKFKLSADVKAFYTLLNALCTNGYIEEAEEIMLNNKKLFPLETESFNIILNGWCNVTVDVFEAKRIWREMSKCCIYPNATTYTHMISCFSKVANLFDSLRLYDEMKKRGWEPERKVYNSLMYVLARENCSKEALKILEKMKESGLHPDSASYNSMIRPLCEAQRLDEARTLISSMVDCNISPDIETYHAILGAASFTETLEILNQMMNAGCYPNGDTLLLVMGKLFKLEQPDNALIIWSKMKNQFGVVPDSSHYTTLIEGLLKCGWLTKAGEFYAEMSSNGFLEDPKLRKLLKDPRLGSTSSSNGKVRNAKKIAGIHNRKGTKT